MIEEQILDTVLKAGCMLLEDGAEVYRVEDTMVRLATSFSQVQSAVSYVTATGVMLSITINGSTNTKIARVKNTGRNLHQINEINSLSRTCTVHELPVEEVNHQLSQFAAEKGYSFFVQTLFGAIGAGGFAIFFGGGARDIICVFFIGIAIRLLQQYLETLKINSFFVNLLLAMLAAQLCVWCSDYIASTNLDTMVISSIMLLVPGLSLTNAIRDTLSGDYLSGLARLSDASLVAIAIALGCGLILYLR
jgi:uncharacterized membrane protein YjjP (DUF1212 family)